MMTGASFKGLTSQTSYTIIILHRKTRQDSRKTVLEPSKPEKATRLRTLRKDRPIFLVHAQFNGRHAACLTFCSNVLPSPRSTCFRFIPDSSFCQPNAELWAQESKSWICIMGQVFSKKNLLMWITIYCELHICYFCQQSEICTALCPKSKYRICIMRCVFLCIS